MSKDYGTESEIRQELDKLTTKEVIQKLKLWLNRPTEDIGIINTEQLMLERLEKDLKILDILKSKFSKTEYGNYLIDEIFWKENYPGYEKHNEEFELIKEWLEEK